MEARISRRLLLTGTGCAAAGSLVGQLLSVARAQEATQARQGQPGGVCMSMVFDDGLKLKFDQDYYVRNHLPMLHEVFGDCVERIELCATVPELVARQGPISMVMTFAGIPAPRAITTLWIKDAAAFGQRLAANSDRLGKDLGAVSTGTRVIQYNRVALELGEPRSAITTDTEVFTVYFRRYVPLAGKAKNPGDKIIQEKAARAATAPPFDARQFAEVYVPKLFSAFPSFAVRRVEATVGLEQGGQKPAQFAAYHIYIRDKDAYEATSADASRQVKEEATRLQEDAVMMFSKMSVKGIA
jgi:hypothetical protein